jgi:hypothetical protein
MFYQTTKGENKRKQEKNCLLIQNKKYKLKKSRNGSEIKAYKKLLKPNSNREAKKELQLEIDLEIVNENASCCLTCYHVIQHYITGNEEE